MLTRHAVHNTGTVSILRVLGLFTLATTLLLSCTREIQKPRSGDLYELKKNTVCIQALLTGYEPGPGSGLIINSDGYCITAGHVVDYACSLEVSSWDRSVTRSDSASCFLRKRSIEDDVALLKLPPDFCSALGAKEIKVVGSVSEDLEGRDVCLWTGCTGGSWGCGYVSRVLTDRRPRRIRIADNFTRIFRGTSGTPVFLSETGELLGIVTDALDVIYVSDSTGQHKATIGPAMVELVSVEPIKQLIADNPGKFLEGSPESGPRYADASTIKRVFEELNVLEAFMKEIMGRKMLFFQHKSHIDEAIHASLEASSFIHAMRQRKEALTEDRALATMFYIRGLETKAVKRNGFEEALEYFQMALRFDPPFAEPRYQIASYNMGFRGDLAEAGRDLAYAQSQDPQNAEVIRSLAVYYLTAGGYDSASYYIREAERLLPRDDDPRIPLYWGVFYDPTYHPEIQSQERVRDLSLARQYYAKSVLLQPYFVTPANNLNWTFLAELKQDTLHLLTKEARQDLARNLRTGLSRLGVLIEWGFRDPRVLDTFVRSYAYLAETGSDSALREDDCRRACGYLSLAEESLKEATLAPSQQKAIAEGLQYGAERCGCRGTEKIVLGNVLCLEFQREGHESGFGHGLVLDDKGYVAVPYHLLEGASQVIISSPYYGEKSDCSVGALPRRYSGDDDIAILKLPLGLLKTVTFQDVRMISSISKELEGEEVWIWTGCTDGNFGAGRIVMVSREGTYIDCGRPLTSGAGGTPVILKKTGELIGIIGGGPGISVVSDKQSEQRYRLMVGPYRVITVESIKKILWK